MPASNANPSSQTPSQDDYASEEAYQAREVERRKEREALMSRLNERQAMAVNLSAVSTLVLAGAGSGKTSVLTARIAKLVSMGVQSREILAVTFTNKASEEMKVRLRKLMDRRTVSDIWSGTFHSLCNKMLRENALAAGLPRSFAILDTDGQEAMCRGILKDLGLTKSAAKEKAKVAAQPDLVDALLSAPSSADPLAHLTDDDADEGENSFVTPAQCASYISSRKEALEPPRPPLREITLRSTANEQMEVVYSMYQERCAKSGLLDFQDLLTRTVELLEKDEDVRRRYQSRFSAILVDEFQDTNDIQYRWLQLIKGERAHVMAVGDDYQSIYAFRGANPKNMFRFLAEMATDRAAPEGRVIKLEQNYRSLPHILEAANAIIARNPNQMAKTLFTSQPDRGERMDLTQFANGVVEAASIARAIHALTRNRKVPPSEIAVLYRTNQQSRLIEQELNKLGVPLTVYGGFRFYERQEVKNLLAYLDLVMDMTRDLSFGRVANFPPRGIGERTIEELRQTAKIRGRSMMEMVGERSETMARNPASIGNAAAQKKQRQLEGFTNLILDLTDAAQEMPLHKLIELVIARSGLREHYTEEAGGSKAGQAEAEERIANLAELVSASRQFILDNPQLASMTGAEQLPEYMAHVTLMTSTSESDMSRKNTVSLMTVHSSKGLEFDHVYLTGLEESVFPHGRAIKEDEERGNGKSINDAMRDFGASDEDDEQPEGDAYAGLVDGESMQEERRLMYVAVTRARKTLTMSCAKERLINGEIKLFEPSRFIYEVPAARLATNGFPGLEDVSARTAPALTRAPHTPAAPIERPRIAGHVAVQGSLDEKVMTTDIKFAGAGSIRVVSKRRERGAVSEMPGETVIDVDRSHPILGNRHFLKNHEDDAERAAVIASYERDLERDLLAGGQMSRAIEELASRVAGGERIALRCWCAPRDCHADGLASRVAQRARSLMTDAASSTATLQAPAPGADAASGRVLAVIGTAGRDKDQPMTAQLWRSMVDDARRRVSQKPALTVVSGGAAWADHLAVRLFLDGAVPNLVLHLPAPLENGRFSGPQQSSASAANYYHSMFSRVAGIDSLAELQGLVRAAASGDPRIRITVEDAAPGYASMFARNRKVAEACNAVLAYTWGGEVADGGTSNTWKQCNAAKAAGDMTHVSLMSLVPQPLAATPAVAQRQTERDIERRAERRAPGSTPGATTSIASTAPSASTTSGYSVRASAPSDASKARLVNLMNGARRQSAPRP